jgi:pathogenesis-related protein 1
LVIDNDNASQSWYAEIVDYEFATGKSKNGKAVGHFTQMVWDDSTALGCGWAGKFNPVIGEDGYYVVCRYGPSGNVRGKHTSHVQCPVSGDRVGIDTCLA